ncbi:TerD family protein [Nocardia sp. CA-135398]|uniref:TerD family protein n=1 Tax=Nocardia sp. CA-135398 TaxID=3239977 RepID=UPI003D965C98
MSPGAVFTRAPRLVVTQNPGPTVEYTAPDFTNRESVVVIAEAYRRNDAWKVRAVGQDYASGLGGLASDYGVDVNTDETPAQVGASTPSGSKTPTELAKVTDIAPELLPVATEANRAGPRLQDVVSSAGLSPADST